MKKPQQTAKRGPGRPEGRTTNPRDVILRVRLTEDEHAIAAGKAAGRGLPVSTWARDTMLSAAR
jgi:hypothetical protein